MSKREEKKNMVISYLLEKIQQKQTSLTYHVSEEFNIAQNTIYTYIKELEQKNIIKKISRDNYKLLDNITELDFYRSKGELYDEAYIVEHHLINYIKELPKNIYDIWSYGLSEMINNVVDHSECEKVHIEIRQNISNTMFIIQDDGVGIFEKIKSFFKLSSIDEAICELFKGKLTTDSSNHSGEGIFFTSKMMDEFYILSSEKQFVVNKYDNQEIIPINNNQGTTIIMSLSNSSKKQSGEIFDLYSDVDLGFTKTYIPLKNIFDASPVSRSQAKRICHRLTEFKEVVLDFENINWMGQGFADQLFRVFQNEYPDIKLSPVNMNEDVYKMYRHVKRGL